MARFSSSFLPALFLCLGLGAQIIAANQVGAPPPEYYAGDLIPIACQRALYKQFCINLLTSDGNGAKTDLKGLAFVALRAAENNATSTSLFIKQSLTKPGLDSQADLQQALSDCGDHYITAVELLEDATSALLSNLLVDVYRFVKAAIADVDSCDASIKDHEAVAPEVTQQNAALRLLFNTALDITDVVKTHH